MVAKIRACLNIHFRGGDQPDRVFTDRGQGFYTLRGGNITPHYADALKSHGLRAFMGACAKEQPGDLKDVLLHETAVSWLTNRLTVTLPAEPWDETVPQFSERLRMACEYVNKYYDVEGLCRSWPTRLEELRKTEGDRLRH